MPIGEVAVCFASPSEALPALDPSRQPTHDWPLRERREVGEERVISVEPSKAESAQPNAKLAQLTRDVRFCYGSSSPIQFVYTHAGLEVHLTAKNGKVHSFNVSKCCESS